jgi:uncharacterized membrane protein
MNAQAAPAQQLMKSRIEALSDGIFAVAMTRLVLDIRRRQRRACARVRDGLVSRSRQSQCAS